MSKLYILAGLILISWVIIIRLEKMGKLNAERHFIFLLLRTERGKEFIERVSRFGFWPFISTLGVVISLLGMAFVIFSLGYAIYSTYFLKTKIEGATLVIPGVTIPFWYGIIGLITVLVVHEVSHGIIARSENISIKNLGAVLFAIIPIGAFVEPDEEELNRKPRISKLRVYSAGSFGNIVLAIIAFFTFVAFSSQVFDPSTIQIIDVAKGSPADGVLEEGMVILRINGEEISSTNDFMTVAREIEPGETISIETDKGNFLVNAGKRKDHPSRGFIGIRVHSAVKEGLSKIVDIGVLLFISGSLQWIFFLNQGIGLINLAPIHFGVAATDGHHILKEIISHFVGEARAEKVAIFISTTTLLILLFTIIGPTPTAA